MRSRAYAMGNNATAPSGMRTKTQIERGRPFELISPIALKTAENTIPVTTHQIKRERGPDRNGSRGTAC